MSRRRDQTARVPAPEPCSGPDCSRPAVRSGLCPGHAWQRQHGRPLAPLAPRSRDRWDRLHRAALAMADAESDRDYYLAAQRLRAAAVEYARTMQGPA